jgi:hypothetical protein
MTIRVDAKGKIFTDIVRKDEVPVLIQTLTSLIQGHIYLRPEARIKDEMNAGEQFIAVTDAEITQPNGTVIKSSFLTLNKAHVVWLRPDEESAPGQ